MWFFIAIAALVIMLWSVNYSKPSVDGVQARFFGPDSTNMFNTLKNSGVSSASLKEFLSMEDQFLAYEKETVCNKVSRITNATAQSQQIKDRFVGYDFSYHNDHIRQMSSPDRVINTNLVCF
jgi:hypothetical protein